MINVLKSTLIEILKIILGSQPIQNYPWLHNTWPNYNTQYPNFTVNTRFWSIAIHKFHNKFPLKNLFLYYWNLLSLKNVTSKKYPNRLLKIKKFCSRSGLRKINWNRLILISYNSKRNWSSWRKELISW